MSILKNLINYTVWLLTILFYFSLATAAQTKTEILAGDSLKRTVPTSFYFAGQSAETQVRNSAAAKIGENRYVVVGLVDTSGYSAEISGKYEGFFITDSAIKIGDSELNTGAYGFGFAKDGKVNFFDLSSKQILSAATAIDAEMKRPRPLMMTADTNGIRLYRGKSYVVISVK